MIEYITVEDMIKSFSNIEIDKELFLMEDEKDEKDEKDENIKNNLKFLDKINLFNKYLMSNSENIRGLKSIVFYINKFLNDGYNINLIKITSLESNDYKWKSMGKYLENTAGLMKIEVFPESVWNDEDIIGDRYQAKDFNKSDFLKKFSNKMLFLQDVSFVHQHDGLDVVNKEDSIKNNIEKVYTENIIYCLKEDKKIIDDFSLKNLNTGLELVSKKYGLDYSDIKRVVEEIFIDNERKVQALLEINSIRNGLRFSLREKQMMLAMLKEGKNLNKFDVNNDRKFFIRTTDLNFCKILENNINKEFQDEFKSFINRYLENIKNSKLAEPLLKVLFLEAHEEIIINSINYISKDDDILKEYLERGVLNESKNNYLWFLQRNGLLKDLANQEALLYSFIDINKREKISIEILKEALEWTEKEEGLNYRIKNNLNFIYNMLFSEDEKRKKYIKQLEKSANEINLDFFKYALEIDDRSLIIPNLLSIYYESIGIYKTEITNDKLINFYKCINLSGKIVNLFSKNIGSDENNQHISIENVQDVRNKLLQQELAKEENNNKRGRLKL